MKKGKNEILKRKGQEEMASNTNNKKSKIQLPKVEEIQRELGTAENIDDFFGRDGIFARLFSKDAGANAGSGINSRVRL